MLLIRTESGSMLLNPAVVIQIEPMAKAEDGSRIVYRFGDEVRHIKTPTHFGELARDLFTKKFVARV